MYNEFLIETFVCVPGIKKVNEKGQIKVIFPRMINQISDKTIYRIIKAKVI